MPDPILHPVTVIARFEDSNVFMLYGIVLFKMCWQRSESSLATAV
jgi:hypothetical protein